jgi:hypothetical protein
MTAEVCKKLDTDTSRHGTEEMRDSTCNRRLSRYSTEGNKPAATHSQSTIWVYPIRPEWSNNTIGSHSRRGTDSRQALAALREYTTTKQFNYPSLPPSRRLAGPKGSHIPPSLLKRRQSSQAATNKPAERTCIVFIN